MEDSFRGKVIVSEAELKGQAFLPEMLVFWKPYAVTVLRVFPAEVSEICTIYLLYLYQDAQLCLF